MDSLLLLLIVVFLAGLTLGGAEAAEVLDPGRVAAIAEMLPAQPTGLGRPISDRAAWEQMAKLPAVQSACKQAEGYLGQALPEQPDDLFLDFSRTGNRTRWQDVSGKRRGRLMPLVVAECVENKGRFLATFEQFVDAVCAEKTWVMPAHDAKLRNFNGEIVDIDLASSALGWELATADWLLGDKLSAQCREKLRATVTRLVIVPFHDMVLGKRGPNWWLLTTSNWNAVCLAGATGAGLALVPDRQQRAELVAGAEHFSRNFLAGFTPDGYCSEGLGYWNYGFGNYVLLAETIRQATGSKLDVLLWPEVKAPAQFGANIRIMNSAYPAFADCSVNARPDSALMWFVNRRLQLGLTDYDDLDPALGVGHLAATMLYRFPNGASEMPPAKTGSKTGIRTWFDSAGILICRPEPGSATELAAALKGGHNAEHHNHNDVGSYTVVLGSRQVLLDPGSEVYTARTFSNRRYDSKLLNSFGHPVPLVAGQMQRPGQDARAEVVRTEFTDETDTLELSLKSAYPVPDLKALTRTFVYSRAGRGSLQITDKVEFANAQSFETALITRGTVKETEPGKLLILDAEQVVEVTIVVTGGEYGLKYDRIEEDSPVKPTRVGIAFKETLTAATVEMTVRPADLPGMGTGLLKNGGFEFDRFFWDIADSMSEVSTEQACEGGHSLKISDKTASGGSNVNSGRMRAEGDREYTLSGQVHHVSGQGIGMYVRYWDVRGRSLNPADEKGNIPPVGSLEGPAGEWAPFSYKFKTPPGTVEIAIWIHSFSAAQVEAYLDDLKIE